MLLKNIPGGEHELSVRVKDTDNTWSETFFTGFLVNQPPTSIIDIVSMNIFHKENPRYVTVDLVGRGFDDVGVVKCEWQMEYLDNERFDLNIEKLSGSISNQEAIEFWENNSAYSADNFFYYRILCLFKLFII